MRTPFRVFLGAVGSLLVLGGCGAQMATSPAATQVVQTPHCSDSQYQSAPRCTVELDLNGSDQRVAVITIDNASTGYSNAEAAQLALTADRSTRNGHPHIPPFRKGLVNGGDIFCIRDKYLAWFDYGKRAGVLAGIWSLNPSTKNFRHLRQDPGGSGDVWAPNEFINGSSSPSGENLYWDIPAPPVEHTFAMSRSNGGPLPRTNLLDFLFFATNYARDGKNSGWEPTVDGQRDGEGVHYVTHALMVNWDKYHAIDVSDGRDDLGAPLIANTVDSSVEYVCRQDDIVTSWTFSPTKADVLQDNLYVAFWLAYGDNEDDTACDAGGPGQQWPHQLSHQPLYVRSSHTLQNNWNGRFSNPGSITRLEIANPPCNRRNDGTYPDYLNPVISIPDPSLVRQGSWLEIGEDPGLAPGTKIFRITMLDEPGSGSGDNPFDPVNLGWHDCGAFNENADGTIGLACGTQGPQPPLKAGVWYRSRLAMRVAQ